MSGLRALALKTKSQIFLKISHRPAYFLQVVCAYCFEKVLVYQKERGGRLEECFLDRIVYPRALRILYSSRFFKEPLDLGELYCPGCGARVGFPKKNRIGRLAYRLRKGLTFKSRCDGV